MVMSKDGHCRAFDAEHQNSSGSGRRRGAAERPKAMDDRDHIYAILKVLPPIMMAR